MKESSMKKATTLTILGALLAIGTAQTTPAQTIAPQTNVTLDLDFYLTTVAQGTVTTNRGEVVNGVEFGSITEASIIRDLGASTSNSFSPRAELLLLIPTNAPTNWTVVVRDGTNSTDVTGFFSYIPGTNSVGRTTLTTATGAVGDTQYSIDRFAVHDQAGFPPLATHFHVSGFTVTLTRGIVPTETGPVGVIEQLDASVAGTGERNGKLIVIEGSIIARGNNLVPGPSPAAFRTGN
jgi:hypothetical protein